MHRKPVHLAVQLQPRLLDGLPDDRVDFHHVFSELDQASRHARDVQQVVDEGVQVPGQATDDLACLANLGSPLAKILSISAALAMGANEFLSSCPSIARNSSLIRSASNSLAWTARSSEISMLAAAAPTMRRQDRESGRSRPR